MQVHDVNSDGELNCIDYTVCFKYTWDMCYTKDDCIIIRNKNKNFHHLFIGVLSGNNLIYVEPQGSCNNYLLRSWWPDFDEQYNIYYETFIWLYIYTDGWLYEKEVQ